MNVLSDEQGCDTSKTSADARMEEMADENVHKTKYNSPSFDFAEKSWKTDFTLNVEGTRFHVARNILALASPVFDTIFESKFKESTSDELELPGKKAGDVKEFLLAIYPNTAFPMSKEDALKVLPLAEEYQVLSLKQRCEEALLGSIDQLTMTDELYRLIKEAHLYNLNELLKRCVSLVCEKSTEEVEKANREIVIPGEPLSDILQNLNDKHVSRIKELESSNKLLANQLETNKTWKHYFSKALRKSEFPTLDEDLIWEGQTWMVTLNVKKLEPVEHDFFIGNTGFKITFDFGCNKNYIYAKLDYRGKNEVKCEFAMQLAIVNKMPTEEHITVKKNGTLVSGQESTNFDIKSIANVEDPKKGFAYEGKIQVQVNIFMSEPKKI